MLVRCSLAACVLVQALAARPLGVPPGEPELRVNGVDANYTTSKLFVDEVAGDAVPLTIVFRPNAADVNPATVQAFTNLNRRDRAQVDADGDGIEDGIVPPERRSRRAPATSTITRRMSWRRPAMLVSSRSRFRRGRTGAYRLTARYQTAAAPGRWVYYTPRRPSRPRHHGLAEVRRATW